MVRSFIVQVRMIPDNVTKGVRPATRFLKPDLPYAVLDVHKFRDKDGLFWTWYLIGDQDSGDQLWIDAKMVKFMGVL